MYLVSAIKRNLIRKCRKLMFSSQPCSAIFGKIYADNLWGSSESVSGPGSGVVYTKELRLSLSELLIERNIKSILDCGCGDFNWMKEIPLRDIKYQGIDVVENLIESNKALNTLANVTFVTGDVINDRLPGVDLLMCRDVLVHLTNDQIRTALQNFYSSGSEYFLITSFSGSVNADTFTGDWRSVNLQIERYNFPQPLQSS